MGDTVLADPQYSTTRILRPYPSFIADYNGKGTNHPIMVSEGGIPLDPQAGKPGYAPNLLAGLAVPLGARVMVWVPTFVATDPTSAHLDERYIWNFIWRLRNTFEYRTGRGPYHYPKEAQGVPDPTTPSSPARIVKPAAWQTVVYNAPQPPTNGLSGLESTVAVQSLDTEGYANSYGFFSEYPYIPGGGVGYMSQGLLDVVTERIPIGMPSYQIVECRALGDELLIQVWRKGFNGDLTGTWDFSAGGPDETLGKYLGTTAYPDIGVYVHMGVAP